MGSLGLFVWLLWAPLLLLVVAAAALVAGHRLERVALRRQLERDVKKGLDERTVVLRR